jgi:hypothetical protein
VNRRARVVANVSIVTALADRPVAMTNHVMPAPKTTPIRCDNIVQRTNRRAVTRLYVCNKMDARPNTRHPLTQEASEAFLHRPHLRAAGGREVEAPRGHAILAS